MTTLKNLYLLAAAAIFVTTPLVAQQQVAVADGSRDAPAVTDSAAAPAEEPAPAKAKLVTTPKIEIQYIRPVDQRGLNMFESPKEPGAAYTGFKLDWGAAFTQQFQGLSHSNTAAERTLTNAQNQPYNANALMEIGKGFNNATANLYLNAQLAPGIRVALSTYLSSRHHNETWVKDGYLLIDESPIDHELLNTLMKYVTVRAGHFEINYGDAHFRRSDNGNAMHNPFVGNYILDAFTTEIGGEVYFRHNGLLAMAAVTGGEIRGNVQSPQSRKPAFYGKLGFDRQIDDDLRVRLTGSAYRSEKSPANTLYAGDRAGSRYYMVIENTQATAAANFTSGALNPNFRNEVTAYQINPFVKFGGLELFGVAEQSSGKTFAETEERSWTHYAGDVVYRFLQDERLYVGARYNTAKGELNSAQGVRMPGKPGADRYQIGGGWFITPNILMKAEYVNQKYNDFPTTDIRNGARFKGFLVEGVVAF